MSTLEDLWRRATATTPVPDTATLLAIALATIASTVLAWPAVRMIVTVCHEAGHAVAATLTGRSLQGIRLHSDTSGLTLTRGRPTGVGMVITLLAGYPAASLVGLLAAAVAGVGHTVALLWLLVGLLSVMLLKIRNVHGVLVVLALGGVLALALWRGPVHLQVWLAHGLAWLLLLAGPRPVLELALSRGRGSAGSDAAQLARLTHVPGIVWIAVWLAITLGALGLGAALMMIPGLLPGAG